MMNKIPGDIHVKEKILLYNPRSTHSGKRRLPLSLLSLGAVLQPNTFSIIDGNIDPDPEARIMGFLRKHPEYRFVGITVMPGEQIKGALKASGLIRSNFPGVKILWGGFFPSQFPDIILKTGYVDVVVRGQGEETLLDILANPDRRDWAKISGISYLSPEGIVHNPFRYKRPVAQDKILPYESLKISNYFNKTLYGSKTIYHNSSLGCPHRCRFCSVKTVYPFGGWQPEPLIKTFNTIDLLCRRYGADSIFFVDADFFPDKERAFAIADHLGKRDMRWKAYARVDQLCTFSADEWRYLAKSGLRALFVGAESASSRMHQLFAKGLNSDLILHFVKRCHEFGIVPDISFIMGTPGETRDDLLGSIALIRRIKSININTNIIIFIYTPFPSSMIELNQYPSFPSILDEWCQEKWQQYCLWDPSDTWQDQERLEWIRDFRMVLYYRFPKLSDKRFQGWLGKCVKLAAIPRYYLRLYKKPFELKWLEKRLHLIQIG